MTRAIGRAVIPRAESTNDFVNVQQDPYCDWLASHVLPELVRELRIEVDVVADIRVYNPFDFFVEQSAETWSFEHGEGAEARSVVVEVLAILRDQATFSVV